MIKKYIWILLMLAPSLHAQGVLPTYYEGGVESPWLIGLDYDLGFGKFFSFNLALLGGISSQVNRAATFGDVYLGEIRTGLRFYINKPDRWGGVFLELTGRFGVYDLPLRSGGSVVVFDRSTSFLFGLGFYIGYRWKRNLMPDMSGIPFIMALEPYMGYTMDTFTSLDGKLPRTVSVAVHRFSIGLKFSIGFYTYYYTPGTMITNEDTGEITRKPLPGVVTNANAGTNTGTNAQPADIQIPGLSNMRPAQPALQKIGAMKDPWENLVRV